MPVLVAKIRRTGQRSRKKRQALEKKDEAARAAAQDVTAFERCEHGCACGVVPCPYAKWKRCPTCGPKGSMCKVRACVAARKPLMLGFNPAVGALEGADTVTPAPGLILGPGV